MNFLHFFYNPSLTKDEKGREFYFDNAKFILIVFVVLAHAISPYKAYSENYLTLWNVINTLHMPCLIFISGFFAKRYLGGSAGIKVQRPFTYLVLYVFSQLAVSLFEAFVLKDNILPSFFQARSSLWFLQCLIAWYFLLPVVAKFKTRWAFPFFVIIGLVINYDEFAGNVAAISRVFVHFPFFLAGYYVSSDRFMKFVKHKFVRIIAVPAIVDIVFLFYTFRDYIPSKLITCNYSYKSIPVVSDMPTGLFWLSRLLFYIAAAILIVSFMALVPRGKTFFSRFGSRTLQVYILHRFLYLAELQYKWWLPLNTVNGRLLMCLIAVIGTFILSMKFLSYPFVGLQSIKIQKLLRRD